MPKTLDIWELRSLLREACKSAGGQKTWAETNHVSPQYVSDVLKGRRDPGSSICEALGYRKRVEYVPDAWTNTDTKDDIQHGEDQNS